MDVFISYSSQDAAKAKLFAEALRAASFTVWLDQWEIVAGDEISRAIENGLRDADFLVLMLSKHSIMSGWVDREWRTKFQAEVDRGQVSVICVRLDDCEISTLLAGKRWISAVSRDYEAVVELVEALKVHQSRRFTEPLLQSMPEAIKAIKAHKPVALIKLQELAARLQKRLSATDLLESLDAEADNLLEEFAETLDEIRESEESAKAQDANEPQRVLLVWRDVAKGNALASRNELQAFKRRLTAVRNREGISSEAKIILILDQIEMLIEEASSQKENET